MAESTPPAAAAVELDSAALRIVLFGMPHAGKSSLLGALAQAAQTQEHLLNGRLTDLTHGLGELQRRLYEDQPRETLEEVIPYATLFESLRTGRAPAPGRQAVLVDCDGRVANELLSRRRSLDVASPEGTLAAAILGADTLVLVIDAAAGPGQVEADFAEFKRFLHYLEQSRGQRSEVGGLPVFLVLTKCDLLAQPRDAPASWMDRIEERKRQVDHRFREFLEEEETSQPVPFGSIDLHVWATAIKRPELVGSPARPREPYGVAELFRQCLETAADFRARTERAARRLLWTVAGSTGIAAAMLALAMMFLGSRPEATPNELLTKVDIYRSREGQTPSSRLREPLQPKISQLTELNLDPQFAALPPDTREFVTTRLEELRDYRAYKDKLLQLRSPALARNERELQAIEKSLHELELPAERRTEWSQTEAALLRNQRLENIKLLRGAVTELDDWYRRLIRQGEELWTFSDSKGGDGAPIPWTVWNNQVATLLDQAETPPHRPADRIQGSSDLTYAAAFPFERVVEARIAWEGVKQRVLRVRDLGAALGLIARLPGRPPRLEIPSPPAFSVDQARSRLLELEKDYPRYRQEFVLAGLPDAIVSGVRQTAGVNYEHLLEAGRQVVLRRLHAEGGNGLDTPENWRRLRSWLAMPDDLLAWRVLATVLARLHDPDAGDPVTALESFVRQERFDLELRNLTLALPDDLKLRPAGPLTIYHRSGGQVLPSLVLERFGNSRRNVRRQVTHYEFRPVAAATLPYRPGDLLWADLPLKDSDNREWMLSWNRRRSQTYQFEKLLRTPTLYRKGEESSAGKLAEGVAWEEVVPERGIPSVPDLVPIVKGEQR